MRMRMVAALIVAGVIVAGRHAAAQPVTDQVLQQKFQWTHVNPDGSVIIGPLSQYVPADKLPSFKISYPGATLNYATEAHWGEEYGVTLMYGAPTYYCEISAILAADDAQPKSVFDNNATVNEELKRSLMTFFVQNKERLSQEPTTTPDIYEMDTLWDQMVQNDTVLHFNDSADRENWAFVLATPNLSTEGSIALVGNMLALRWCATDDPQFAGTSVADHETFFNSFIDKVELTELPPAASTRPHKKRSPVFVAAPPAAPPAPAVAPPAQPVVAAAPAPVVAAAPPAPPPPAPVVQPVVATAPAAPPPPAPVAPAPAPVQPSAPAPAATKLVIPGPDD